MNVLLPSVGDPALFLPDNFCVNRFGEGGSHVIPVIIAHRGASGKYPENTMESFQAALRRKADGIELDVQLTLDGEVVVIHDHFLDRTTNGTGLVRDHTWEELQAYSAGAWMDHRYKQARIPSFREVCRFIQPTALSMIIEMKNFLSVQPHLEEKVIDIVREFRLSNRVIFSSFNFNSLLRIKELDSRLITALLYLGPLREPWEICREYEADQLHAPIDQITPALVRETKRRDIPIYAWTVDGAKQMKAFAAMKVDGLITNYPLRARKLFYRNHQT